MKALRKAAGALLDELGGAAAPPLETEVLHVERMTCEVRGPQRSELVSMRLEDGRLDELHVRADRGCA